MGRPRVVPRLSVDLPGVLSPRMVAAKRNGALGGKARSRNLTADQITAIGEKGGAALLAKYGHAYFKYIRRRVKLRHPVKDGN